MSDFKTTAAAGTRRLAVALREVVRSASELEAKEQIAAAARLAGGIDGSVTSIREFSERFGLSDDVYDSILRKLSNPDLQTERFRFSAEEFTKHVPYQSLELDNGAMLTAPTDGFDDCFSRAEQDFPEEHRGGPVKEVNANGDN